MKKTILLSIILICFWQIKSQDTFSICAIDTITGEVGSAGASCVYISQGIRILSDVHPGVGVIHSQAYYLQANQAYARSLMNMGLSPQQIIDSLVENDAQNNPTIRQYGIVDFRDETSRSAAYTGSNCDNYKNHITGPNYAIQGNILLGQQILDSMEARFLRAEGELACRLMEALQGAKVPGADTRCMADGISSIGAFLRVAQANDPVNNLYLDFNIPSAADGVDPIDSLQVLIDNWGGCINTQIIETTDCIKLKVYPNPANQQVAFSIDGVAVPQSIHIQIHDVRGQLVAELEGHSNSIISWDVSSLPKGIYLYTIVSDQNNYTGKISVN
ncbi:MAG: DUF1028 domain-containing protein [Bacteroidales bacterium]|jgi:uncharacterized Ntn-hydrolase superfamily protein|nr:DUF1028 domain-containing protein [Bacteroidales bacterium]